MNHLMPNRLLLLLAPALLSAAFCSATTIYGDEPSLGPAFSAPEKVADIAPVDEPAPDATPSAAGAKAKAGAEPKADDRNAKKDDKGVRKEDAAKSQTAPAAPSQEKELEAKREKVAEEIRVAQRQVEAATASGSDSSAPNQPLARKPELLKRRDSLLAQRQALAVRHTELLKSLANARKRAQKGQPDLPAGGPPYSFLELEKLRDSLSNSTARGEMNEAALAEAQDAVKLARAAAEEKEARRVLAKEAVRNSKESAATEKLQGALELAELETEVAREGVQLRESELAAEKLAVEINELRLKSTRAKLEAIAGKVEFKREDLQERLLALDTAESEIKTMLESLAPGSVAVRLAEQQWMDARSRLEATTDRSPALSEEVSAWRRARQTQQQQVASANKQMQRIGAMREAWNRRFAVFNDQNSRDDLAKWREEIEQAVEQFGRDVRLDTVRVDQIRKEQSALEDRARRADRQLPDVARWIDQQRREIQELLSVYEADRVQLEAARRLHGTLLAEIKERTDTKTAKDYWEDSWRSVKQGWNFVLTTVGTNESPITVGKVISGVLLVILGYFLARWISRLFAGRLPRRFGVTQNAASAMESLSFYVLLAMFTVISLYYVDVPLTAFTIAGGAVALGVGFGSQNIINNFISGLILLAEQPIRVGDQIQIEGVSAKVEHIGARSTRVRTSSNQEIIVPNSSFLQNNVINWTLSDTNVRGEIKLGVAFGSDLELTRNTLIAAAKEHELVMDQPAPFVWLMDFGDNAVQFELHFWIQMASSSQRRQVESDIRFIIDRRFREKNLVMAFPQRDVHLSSERPLAVQIIDADLARHRTAA